jgi:hypothetical protein
MVALTWAATSRSADDQDACRIGAVSPEEYRTIAAEIAALPAVDWQEIHDDPLGVSEDLENRVAAAIRDRIHAVIAARESSDQKVAAMHAVLRSIGAEFAWVDLIHTYMHPDYRHVPAAVYHYRIDVNRVGVLRPLLRWGRIDVNSYADKSWETISELRRVTFHIAVPFSRSISGLKEDLPQTRACPPVPADAERPARRQEPAGNATPLPEQPPSRETLPRGTLEPLDDDALRRALYGNYVRRLDLEGLYDVNDTQYFCSDGKYGEFGGGRASVSGRFSISNGTVRVVYPQGRISYRRFYVDARGSY